jgi:hypothetical protein
MPIALGNLSTSTANIYVSSGNTAVTFLSLCNHSAGNVVANVFVVPSGDTASTLNMVLSSIELAANDTYQFYAGGEKLLLSNNDAVAANCDSPGNISTVTSYTVVYPN